MEVTKQKYLNSFIYYFSETMTFFFFKKLKTFGNLLILIFLIFLHYQDFDSYKYKCDDVKT